LTAIKKASLRVGFFYLYVEIGSTALLPKNLAIQNIAFFSRALLYLNHHIRFVLMFSSHPVSDEEKQDIFLVSIEGAL